MKTNLLSRNDLTKNHLALTLTLSVLSCYLMAGCASNKNLQPANAIPGVGGGGFELADTNHDGKLSRAEASDFLSGEIFAARDNNHDGQITKAEWTAADRKDTAGFTKRDANHDGVMTRDEALKYSRSHGLTKKAFADADKNHDGFLDRAEVQAYYGSREGNPESH
jgi:hypothetical protein